jgi:DNA-binding CsgD family transcriptional regulator
VPAPANRQRHLILAGVIDSRLNIACIGTADDHNGTAVNHRVIDSCGPYHSLDPVDLSPGRALLTSTDRLIFESSLSPNPFYLLLIGLVYNQGDWLSPLKRMGIRMEIPVEKLSEREIEILARLADGLTDQQIAEALFLSLNTVKWYNRQIYSKLGVKSRTQAIARARELQPETGGNLLVELTSVPAASMKPPAAIQHLPADLTSFIGRRRECDEIKQMLEQSRLVTLIGPPGVGKTRLSLQVAREISSSFRDGVYFVPLAPLQAVENILWALTITWISSLNQIASRYSSC